MSYEKLMRAKYALDGRWMDMEAQVKAQARGYFGGDDIAHIQPGGAQLIRATAAQWLVDGYAWLAAVRVRPPVY